MKTLWIYLYAILITIQTLPELKRAQKLPDDPYGPKGQAIYKIPQSVSKRVIKKTKTHVTVTGLEQIPEGPVLFASNHQGLFDILLLLGYIERPIGFIAKKEIKKIPLIRSWMKELQCVFIDRSNRRAAIKVIEDGVNSLKRGQNMVIFPEGTRSKGGPIVPFKSGSLRLGTRAEVPIVPITINGTHLMLEANDGKMKQADVSLTVGEPLMPEDYKDLKSQKIADIIYERVKSNLK
mgnify:CR=1 FL=1|jgi:1-acyl-sn-glycerol-3-phosphate acyltransferase